MVSASSSSNSTTDGASGIIDRIGRSFDGKIVLITGGTGFLGKVLVEKLLRKCPGIEKIILLVRTKKGKEPKERIEEMFNGPLFSSVVEAKGLQYLLSKVTAVNGDTMVEDLGLSEVDRSICHTANIIVHSAASVRFDEGLKKAVLLNTRGTQFMLDLAKECSNLELFIHISTAYCHPDEKVLEEKYYPSTTNPSEVIDVLQNTDDATIDILTPKILGVFPNTYAYSKCLAETLVEEASTTLPVVLLRPSVVIPIYKEPIPGWTDNINGPTGLLIGAGKGVLRTMYGDDSGCGDFIPVDCVANVLMICVWDYLVNGCHHSVVNLTTSAELKVTWKEMLDIGKQVVSTRVPLDNVVWFPGGYMTRYRWLHRLRALLYHWIPAILVDLLLFCLGIKPVLLRVHRRINKGMEILEYYTSNQWVFRSDTAQAVREKLTPEEREAYKTDAIGLDKEKYFEDGLLAARRYILKEKDENIPRAMRHMTFMRYLDKVACIGFYVLVTYFAVLHLSPCLNYLM